MCPDFVPVLANHPVLVEEELGAKNIVEVENLLKDAAELALTPVVQEVKRRRKHLARAELLEEERGSRNQKKEYKIELNNS